MQMSGGWEDKGAITTHLPHGMEVGDRLTVVEQDRRIWMRIIYFILCADPPFKKTEYIVSEVVDDTSFFLAKDGPLVA